MTRPTRTRANLALAIPQMDAVGQGLKRCVDLMYDEGTLLLVGSLQRNFFSGSP
jgi:hypothetical protein